jgi:hypothetical protein
MAILTGGLHTATQITRQDTAAAFDANDELLPCGLLRFGNEEPVGPYSHSAALDLDIYVYQRGGSGYSSVEAARKRIYTLLHRQSVVPENGGTCWQIRHTNDVLDTRDDVLDASLAVARFRATWLKG